MVMLDVTIFLGEPAQTPWMEVPKATSLMVVTTTTQSLVDLAPTSSTAAKVTIRSSAAESISLPTAASNRRSPVGQPAAMSRRVIFAGAHPRCQYRYFQLVEYGQYGRNKSDPHNGCRRNVQLDSICGKTVELQVNKHCEFKLSQVV